MKKALSIFTATVLAFVFTACSPAGGITTFTAAVENMPSNFDPQIASASEDLLVIENIYDGLFEKINGEIVNNLAEDYSVSSDGRTYTITIKEGCTYSYKTNNDKKEKVDGLAVTADDFVFALQRICDPSTHSPYIDDFSNIKNARAIKNGSSASTLGVYAADEYTLVIQLENPDYNFIEKLCSSAAFPCNRDFFNSCGGAYGLSIENMLTNGPFRLSYLDSEGGNATLVRNRETGGYLSRIRLKLARQDELQSMYESESISGYFSYDKYSAYATSVQSFDSSVLCLVFNSQKTDLSNENIRQALAWYAFGFTNSGANMQAVSSANSIFPAAVSVGGKPVNQAIGCYTPSYMQQEPKSLLQQGMNRLRITKLESMTVLMPSDSIYSLIYENINQLWQRDLGLYFTIEYLPSSQINQKVAQGDFDIAFMPLTPDGDTPYGILDVFSLYDRQVADYTRQAKGMTDQSAAVSIIKSAQQKILQSALCAPMGSESTYFYCKSYFKDIYANPFTRVINLKHAQVS